MLEDWQRKDKEKLALVAWVLGKEEREVKEEEEQTLNIEVMEVLELERREKEKHTAVGEQLVEQDEQYLDYLVQRKADEQLEEDEEVFLEYLEEEQKAKEEMAEELNNEDTEFLLQYCVDNVGPAKDDSYQEVEEMLAELEEEDVFAWVVEGVLILVAFLVGLFGNGFSIVIFSRQKVHRIFHHLLLLLAIFDMVSY